MIPRPALEQEEPSSTLRHVAVKLPGMYVDGDVHRVYPAVVWAQGPSVASVFVHFFACSFRNVKQLAYMNAEGFPGPLTYCMCFLRSQRLEPSMMIIS